MAAQSLNRSIRSVRSSQSEPLPSFTINDSRDLSGVNWTCAHAMKLASWSSSRTHGGPLRAVGPAHVALDTSRRHVEAQKYRSRHLRDGPLRVIDHRPVLFQAAYQDQYLRSSRLRFASPPWRSSRALSPSTLGVSRRSLLRTGQAASISNALCLPQLTRSRAREYSSTGCVALFCRRHVTDIYAHKTPL